MSTSPTTSPWSNLGLAWASLERPEAHVRLERALLRWDVLPAPSRMALRQLVLYLVPPPAELAAELAAVQLVGLDQGRCTQRYGGAALVALDSERRALEPALATALVAWYGRGAFRIRKTYTSFEAARPRDAGPVFAELERRHLVEQRQGKLYRSTARGWAVARLVEDAVALGCPDDDGPTSPRLAAQAGRHAP
jgi:hypothetical protein